jgi:parallel beta-helix repeat protein
VVYKKYRYYKGKKLGPYYYESVRQPDGTVKSVYLGKKAPKGAKIARENIFKFQKPEFFNRIQPRYFIVLLIAFVLIGGFLFLTGSGGPLATGYATLPDGPGGCSNLTVLNETNISTSITLCAGTYYMNDTYNDGVVVENNGTLVIDTDSIELDCNGAIIRGDGQGYGIFMENRTGVTIRNCVLQGYNKAINVYNTNDSHIVDNEVDGSAVAGLLNGIYVRTSTDLNISNNSVHDTIDAGITMVGLLGGMKPNSDNIFYNNSLYDSIVGDGLDLTVNENSTIYENLIYSNGGTGIDVTSGGYNHSIYNNTIYENVVYGIEVAGSNTTVFWNNISDNIDSGIVVIDDNNTIHNNTITGNDEGIYVSSANFLEIYNNTVNLSTAENIYLSSALNSNVSNNTALNGTYGIRVDGTSLNNNIMSNNASGNSIKGISIEAGLTLIYDNYMSENLVNVYDGAAGNNWTKENTTGTNIIGGSIIAGNYYDNYSGKDTDGDYIGDSAYVVEGQGGTDTYPLWYPSPVITTTLVYPSAEMNVTYYTWFNVTVNVSCTQNNCGNIDVTLDPIGDTSNSDVDEWTMRGRFLNRTSYTISDAPSNISKIVKSYTTGDDVYSSPVIYDGFVYFGSDDFKVYKVNITDMSLNDSYTTGNYARSTPAIAEGYLYVGSNDQKIYKLNATDMNLNSSYNTTAKIWASAPAVVNGSVYVASNNKKIYQINATDMTYMAKFTLDGPFLGRPTDPALENGYLYVGSANYKMYQLNATDMLEVNNFSTNNSSRFTSDVVLANGFIYFGSHDGHVFQLNATDMIEENNYTVAGGDFSDSIAYANGYIYAIGGVSASEQIYQLNSTDMTLVNNYSLSSVSTLSVGGGYLYIGIDGVTAIVQLNATDLTYITNYTTNGGTETSPAIADGNVYIGTQADAAGKMYQFGSVKGTVSTTPGAIPFWTNKSTNPVTVNLAEGASENVTFWVNATGEYYAMHEFFVYTNQTADSTIGSESAKVNVTTKSPVVVTLSLPGDGQSASAEASQNFICDIADTQAATNLTLYIWKEDGSLLYSDLNDGLSGPDAETNWDYTLPSSETTLTWNCKGWAGSEYMTDYVWAAAGNRTLYVYEDAGTTDDSAADSAWGGYWGGGTVATYTYEDIETMWDEYSTLYGDEETAGLAGTEGLQYSPPISFYGRSNTKIEVTIDVPVGIELPPGYVPPPGAPPGYIPPEYQAGYGIETYWELPDEYAIPEEYGLPETWVPGENLPDGFVMPTDFVLPPGYMLPPDWTMGTPLPEGYALPTEVVDVKTGSVGDSLRQEKHTITIMKVSEQNIRLGIRSDYWELIIEKDETVDADLNQDGDPDLAITYDGMKADMAKLTFKKILKGGKEEEAAEDEEFVKPLFEAYGENEIAQMLKEGEDQMEKKEKKSFVKTKKFKIVISVFVLGFIAVVQVIIFVNRRKRGGGGGGGPPAGV